MPERNITKITDIIKRASTGIKGATSIKGTPPIGVAVGAVAGKELIISGLKEMQLISLTSTLSEAIANKKHVFVSVNSKEPEEILKGTYVAGALSKHGYTSFVKFLDDKDEIDWTFEPPSE